MGVDDLLEYCIIIPYYLGTAQNTPVSSYSLLETFAPKVEWDCLWVDNAQRPGEWGVHTGSCVVMQIDFSYGEPDDRKEKNK